MTFIYDFIRIPWIYICVNINFLRQGFRKLSSDGDRQTDEHERNRGWSITCYSYPLGPTFFKKVTRYFNVKPTFDISMK